MSLVSILHGGMSPTLSQPEWYFAHILNVSHEHRPFLELVAQRLLRTSKYSSINAWVSKLSKSGYLVLKFRQQREFSRLLFPILIRKIKRSMPTLMTHPALLAHTIYQSIAFDEALREAGFALDGTMQKPTKGSGEWEGISEIILGNDVWFDAWLEGERKCKRHPHCHGNS